MLLGIISTYVIFELRVPLHSEVKFVILILCPSEVKVTKTALETGRTFATLFADMTLRHALVEAGKINLKIKEPDVPVEFVYYKAAVFPKF